jgi:hypothetical protein
VRRAAGLLVSRRNPECGHCAAFANARMGRSAACSARASAEDSSKNAEPRICGMDGWISRQLAAPIRAKGLCPELVQLAYHGDSRQTIIPIPIANNCLPQ